MSEIDKLYKNVGIEPDINYICDIEPCGSRSYDRVESYPEFTADKQIELIKWLAEWDYTVRIDFHENEWGIATEYYGGNFQDNLSEALSSIINNLWRDLSEEEQKQIKEILE